MEITSFGPFAIWIMDGDWGGKLLFENDWLIGSYKLSMDKLKCIEINIGRNISKDINNINLIKR